MVQNRLGERLSRGTTDEKWGRRRREKEKQDFPGPW